MRLRRVWQRWFAGGYLLLVWLLGALPAWAVTGNQLESPSRKAWPVALIIAPRLALSDDEKVSTGAGVALQVITSPLERFGIGLEASWSHHGNRDFLRAALLLEILIDDLAIHPVLQTGVGLQMRIQADGILLTPDIHVGLGFDLPVLSWLTLGASFHIAFPIDASNFPITKTLHLRTRLVF